MNDNKTNQYENINYYQISNAPLDPNNPNINHTINTSVPTTYIQADSSSKLVFLLNVENTKHSNTNNLNSIPQHTNYQYPSNLYHYSSDSLKNSNIVSSGSFSTTNYENANFGNPKNASTNYVNDIPVASSVQSDYVLSSASNVVNNNNNPIPSTYTTSNNLVYSSNSGNALIAPTNTYNTSNNYNIDANIKSASSANIGYEHNKYYSGYSNTGLIKTTNNNSNDNINKDKINFSDLIQVDNFSKPQNSNYTYNYNKIDFDKIGLTTNSNLNSTNLTNIDIKKKLQNLNIDTNYAENTNNSLLVSSGNTYIKSQNSTPRNLNQNIVYTTNASNNLASSGNNYFQPESFTPNNPNQNIVYTTNINNLLNSSSTPKNLNQNIIYSTNNNNLLVSNGNNYLKPENSTPKNPNQNVIYTTNNNNANSMIPITKQPVVNSNISANSLNIETNIARQNDNKIKKFLLNDFFMLKTLGKGAFGRVRVCQNKLTGFSIAIKALKKSEIIQRKQGDHILNEIKILNLIDHPFSVKFEGFSQDPRFVYLGLELINGGELFTYLRRNTNFPVDQSRFYIAHIVLIFEYMHAKNIAYRDLKPENVLIDKHGYLKLTDMGLAKVVENRTYTFCGTPEYMAPEIVSNKGYGKYVDWWAAGIMLYEMLVGIDPFNDGSGDQMKIFNNILTMNISFPKDFDPDAKSLIKHLCDKDLTKRYGNLKNGVADIKNHRFFKNFSFDDLINRRIRPNYIPPIKGENDTSQFMDFPDSLILPNSVNPTDDIFAKWFD